MLVHKVKIAEFIYKRAPRKVRNKRAVLCKVKATRFRTIVDEFIYSNTFDRLRTVAGFACNQLSQAPTHNNVLREGLEIPADFRTQQHKDIYDEFFDIVFAVRAHGV